MQKQIKIMNLLLSDENPFLGAPTLLVRSTCPYCGGGEKGVWTLKGPGCHDFTTFFNALPLSKWKEYTSIDRYFLHLELRGASCVVKRTRATAFSFYSEEDELEPIHKDESGEWLAFDIAFSASDGDVLESFKLECAGDVDIRNSYYYVEVDEERINPVELALCTTTFKKEEFIARNIDLVKSNILGSEADDIAGHFHMHVVDNGRSLEASSFEGRGVSIHPNDNVGGAGGFARGMIEAMSQSPKATHVLLMDDDVLLSPESIIRTYNLLRLVNEGYREAFVSGAMMNMDEPNIRWEDMGFIGFDGAFHPVKPVARMDVLHDVVAGETYDIPSYMPGCEDQVQHYAAWWYCCIPVKQIERNGLPLPIFVRGDDAEYSRRCKPNFMTMSGICIWHLSFHMRYNAAQERYQMVRNCFIDQFTSDIAPVADFESSLRKMVDLELRKFNYADAELAIRGFEDFLRGPKWLATDEAKSAFLDANKAAAKTFPLHELEEELSKHQIDLSGLTDWKIWRDLPYGRTASRIDRITANGQRITTAATQKGKVAVIDNVGWADPRGKLRGAETVVVIDIPNSRGAIRHIDRKKYRDLNQRFRSALRDYHARRDELKREYSEARGLLTSFEYWKSYLGI